MEYDGDYIVNEDSQCLDQEQAALLVSLAANAAPKPPVKGETMILSRDVLRIFNASLPEVEE